MVRRPPGTTRTDPLCATHRSSELRGDRADPRVGIGELRQGLAKDDLIARRPRRRLGLRAGDDVEALDAVIFVCRILGRGIALALLGHDMDEDRRSEEHTSELLSLMRNTYAVYCMNKKTKVTKIK